MPSIMYTVKKYSPKEMLCSWQDWSTEGEKCTKEKSVPIDALTDILLHKVCFKSLCKWPSLIQILEVGMQKEFSENPL